MKNLIKVAMIIGAIIILVIILKTEVKNYNNGICIKCGTEYQAIGVGRTGGVCYECPNCHFTAWK